MTPKTLRKERREKFLEILKKHFPNETGLVLVDISEELANAAESRTERNGDKIDALRYVPGIEAAMFGNRAITKDDFDPEAEPLKAFEAAMHLPGNWQWYPGKSSDEKAWKGLRAFVVKIYLSEGAKSFEEYFTWSIQPYSRGAMTALAIKQNPGNFEASWAAFRAVNPKQEEVKPIQGGFYG